MYKVSTQTFIAYTDIGELNLPLLYNSIKLSYDVLGVKYKAQTKGIYKPIGQETCKNLRCLTLRVRVVDEVEPSKRSRKKVGPKIICVKIFRNGTMQLTGCKAEQHVFTCLKVVFESLSCDRVLFHLQSVMFNVAYQLDHTIDREKLIVYLAEVERINVPPLTSDSVGLKLKLPYNRDVYISLHEWKNGEVRLKEMVPYKIYFAGCVKKLKRQFDTSITIFANGKVTLSGVDVSAIDYTVAWLNEFMRKAKSVVTETKREIKTFRRPQIK